MGWVLRGSQAVVLQYLRRGAWVGGVPALAAVLGLPERAVWLAVGSLDARGLIDGERREDGAVRLVVTRRGRGAQLRLGGVSRGGPAAR